MPSTRFRHLALTLPLLLLIALAAVGLGGALPALAAGAVSLTSFGATYTENFDTLASSGTTEARQL